MTASALTAPGAGAAPTARTRGLVLGKFYPPHAGHHYLIDSARGQVDELVVLVMASTVESIPGTLRHRWLRERHPDCDVRLIRDDNICDYDDPAVWDRHMALIRQAVPDSLDVVFSSEAYGMELARRLGARAVCVDAERDTYPVSGTLVRENPAANWECLTPAVRAYLTKRVVVCGAESTGTTTLAQALAAHYQTEYVPEFGRSYSEDKNAAGTGEQWTPEDFMLIAARQQFDEDRAARTAGPVLICDTDALATTLFEELYLGAVDPVTEHLHEQRTPPALYLLTSDEDVPFEDDGTRLFESRRAEMTGRFRQRLAEQPAPWMELTGTPGERLQQAVDAVDALLADGWHFAAPLG